MQIEQLIFWLLFCLLFVPWSLYVFCRVGNGLGNPGSPPVPDPVLYALLLIHFAGSVIGAGVFGGMLVFNLTNFSVFWHLAASIAAGLVLAVMAALLCLCALFANEEWS